MQAWGEWQDANTPLEKVVNGHVVSNIRIEQAYKGNFHLFATIDGQERKFVIGKNKEEYAMIEKTGIANLTAEQLQGLVETFFKL